MIIDTNVIVSVDDPNPVAREHCVIRCRELLSEATSAVVALDSNDEILLEYIRNVRRRDYPLGVGASFVRYVENFRFDETLFERVELITDPDRATKSFQLRKNLQRLIERTGNSLLSAWQAAQTTRFTMQPMMVGRSTIMHLAKLA